MKKVLSLFGSFMVMVFLTLGCGAQDVPRKSAEEVAAIEDIGRVVKTADEWKKELSKFEYYVLRESGTEKAFSGDLWDNKEVGTYVCRGCQLSLFDSKTKFKSGTGWPSYYQPFKKEYVTEITDNKYGWNRVEVVCSRCDGHLGHVFDDGPAPTGLRYCINSASLDFVEESAALDSQ